MRTDSARWAGLRRIVRPALDALHGDRRSVTLVVIAGVAALLSYVPVATLRGPGGDAAAVLRLPATPVPLTDIRWTTAVRSAGETQQSAIGDLLFLLFVTAVGALAVAVLAMASVLAARAWRRAGEFLVRRSVGASRRNLLLSALGESLAVSLVVAGGGILLASMATRAAIAAWPGVAGGWRLAVGLALGTVLATLVVAALVSVGEASSRRRLVDAGSGTVPAFIPAIQLGLSLAVLLASVAVLRQVPRVETSQVAGVQEGRVTALDASAIPPAEQPAAFASLVTRLDGIDGVTDVSLASRGQAVGLGVVDFVKTDCGICPVGMILLPWRELYAAHFFVSGDTFRTQGARIVAGRGFTAADRAGADPVAVVNRFMAARYFQDGQAVGRDLFVGAGLWQQRHRVVGIVDDARPAAFGGGGQPLEAVYFSVLQHPVAAADLLVRTAGNPGEAARAVADAVSATPGLRQAGVTTERELFARETAPLTWFGRAFAIEALAIFLIALVGTSTAMALWVQALGAELSLRRAVGASRRRAMAWVLVRAAGVGLRGAVVGAVFFAPVVLPELERLMPGAEAWDPATLAVLAVILAVTALAGAVVPARAALRAPPAAGLAPE